MNSWPVDPAQLLALLALLEEKHVTRAASRLGITQSTMSHRLRQLRESLGDELLVRSSDGYALTSRAEELLPSLAHALQAISVALTPQTPFDPKTAHAHFKMALPDLLAPHLPGLCRWIHSRASGIRLEIVPVPGNLDQAFEEDRCALAIAPEVFAQEHHLTRSLGELSFGVVSRKGHPATENRLTLKGWLASPHVVVSVGHAGANIIDESLKERGMKREIGLIVPGFLAGLVAVAGSNMLMNAPLPLAQDVSRLLKVQTRPAPIALRSVKLAMMWHRKVHQEPTHVWLRAQLHAFLSSALTVSTVC